MIALYFTFNGLNELIADFERAQAMLSAGFEEPLRRTRDALWQEIRELFASRGQSTTHGPAAQPWRDWAADTRDRRNLQLPTTWVDNDYYDAVGDPIENLIGVWTGQMREAFTSDVSPGFSDVSPDVLEMGVRPTGIGEEKWHGFINGWSTSTAHQPPRPVYENLHAEDVALNVFANWLRDEVPLFQ